MEEAQYPRRGVAPEDDYNVRVAAPEGSLEIRELMGTLEREIVLCHEAFGVLADRLQPVRAERANKDPGDTRPSPVYATEIGRILADQTGQLRFLRGRIDAVVAELAL
jgi:hypothetical protein